MHKTLGGIVKHNHLFKAKWIKRDVEQIFFKNEACLKKKFDKGLKLDLRKHYCKLDKDSKTFS